MNSDDLVCVRCGQKNSHYRCWCEGCRTPLPQPSHRPAADVPTPAERKRTRIYELVLDDLDRLAQTGEVPSAESAAIGTFCRAQIRQVEEQQCKRGQAISIDRLTRTVRNLAQAGQFEGAIQALRAGAGKHSAAFPHQQMLQEIQQKDAQERAMNQFMTRSQELLRHGQAEEARQKLVRASELDPHNEAVQVALAEINASISAASSPNANTTTQVREPVDSDVTNADSVECDDDRQKKSLTKGVDEDTVVAGPAPPVLPEPIDFPEIDSSRFATLPQSSRQPEAKVNAATRRSFAEVDEEVPNPTHRLIDAASQWSTVLKPFLVDNVGWFVGAFLVIAGFVVLIVSFWGNIEQNQILMHSLVFLSLATTTGMFFAMAYFMRLKYPQLESSSNVLLVIVALLIPLVFAAAVMTTLVPGAPADLIIQASME